MQTKIKDTTVSLADNCLGSGRGAQAVTRAGQLISYRCPKCSRIFGLNEVVGLPTYRTLPVH